MCILAVSCLDGRRKSVAWDFPCIRQAGRQEGAAPVALWLGTVGEMMDHAAEETFPGAGCGQAGDPGPPSAGCMARVLCPQMPTLSSGL